MICYKDMTFCPFRSCENFDKCGRALTDKVLDDAEKWWGSKEAPICQFSEPPGCFNIPEPKDEYEK